MFSQNTIIEKNKFIHACLIVFVPIILKAQSMPQIIPPSPEAANIARYADVPVSLYTGKPQIEFPLYTLKCGNLELPISLSYYASGIKVEDYPTWAGIGWALNAGGVITRTIRGSAFSNSGNNLGEYLPLGGKTSTEKFNALVALDNKNKEGDIFYYNFSQYAGSFQIKNNNPVFRKYANLKINFPADLSFITVTDDSGNIYYFEPKSSGEFQTDYYLVKIESVDRLHAIYFEYIPGDWYGEPPHNSVFYSLYPVNYIKSSADNFEVKRSGYLLSKIYTSQNDSIEFIKKDIAQTSESTLFDHRQALDSIFIYNGNNKLLSFHLKTNNVETIKPYSDPYSDEYPIPLSDNNGMDYRLYLDGFEKIDKADNVVESYGFEYYGRANNSKDSLANRYSLAQDLGGYYNGQDNNTTLIPSFDQNLNPQWSGLPGEGNPDLYGGNVNIPGANRNPNIKYMRMGTLKSINYPTGGSAKFYYSQMENPLTNEPFWGLKIDKIEYLDSDGSLQKRKEYIYQNPYLGYQIPSNWHYTLHKGVETSPFPVGCDQLVEALNCSSNIWNWAIELSPEPVNDLGMNEGPMIGYNFVNEIENGNGSTQYEFAIEGACFEEAMEYEFPVTALIGGGSSSSGISTYNAWPLGPIPNNSWKMGTLLSKTVYGEDNLVKKDYHYHYSHHILDTIPGVKAQKIGKYISTGYAEFNSFYYYEFNYLSTWERLDSITETIDGITKVTSYNYDDHKQVSQIRTTKSNGDLLTTDFTHPYDYPTTVYGDMVSRNMLAPVIEKTETTNTAQTELVKTNYSFWKTEGSSSNLVSGRLEVEKGSNSFQTVTFSIAETAQLSINFNLWKDGEGFFYFEGYGPPDIHEGSGIIETTLDPGNYTLKLSFTEASYPATDFYGTADYSVDIEDIKYNMTASSAVTNYIYPLSVEVKKGESPIETRLNFNGYDRKGNIISVSKTNDIEEIYVWGYNLRYPIAKIINSDYLTVESLLGGPGAIKDFCSLPYPSDTAVKNFLSPLLTGSGTVQDMMVTTYTYDPLVGITSITDPKGNTIYYGYDDFNRLKEIRDADGNLVNDYGYHYKGEDNQ